MLNVTVSRGGSEVSLALPRGPLGVGLDTASVDPQQQPGKKALILALMIGVRTCS
jgi:hypothetical protein